MDIKELIDLNKKSPAVGKTNILSRRDFLIKTSGAVLTALFASSCSSSDTKRQFPSTPDSLSGQEPSIVPNSTPRIDPSPTVISPSLSVTKIEPTVMPQELLFNGKKLPITEILPGKGGEELKIEASKALAYLNRPAGYFENKDGEAVSGFLIKDNVNKILEISKWDGKESVWKDENGTPLRRWKVPSNSDNVVIRLTNGSMDSGRVQTKNDPPLAQIPNMPYFELSLNGKKVKMVPIFNPDNVLLDSGTNPENSLVRCIAISEMQALKQIPERVIDNETKDWKLSDKVEDPIHIGTYIDPMTEAQIQRYITGKVKINIPTEIKLDKGHEGKTSNLVNKELPLACINSDTKGLANSENSGVAAIHNSLLWVIAQSTHLDIENLKAKSAQGILPIIKVKGKTWNPNMGVDILFSTTKLNQDINVTVPPQGGGLGYGYDLMSDGGLILTPLITGVGPEVSGDDYNRTNYTIRSMEILAKDLGIDVGNPVFSKELHAILSRFEVNGDQITLRNLYLSK